MCGYITGKWETQKNVHDHKRTHQHGGRIRLLKHTPKAERPLVSQQTTELHIDPIRKLMMRLGRAATH